MRTVRAAASNTAMADAKRGLIEVEVVYALRQRQIIVALKVAAGTTAGEAITRSGIATELAGAGGDSMVVGIFGRRVPLATVLREHDRVEIYRPLIADPKQARRGRAKSRKTKRP